MKTQVNQREQVLEYLKSLGFEQYTQTKNSTGWRKINER